MNELMEKIAEDAFIDELEKISAITSNKNIKPKDSSYVKDFLYGVDPTGVRTFNTGLKNKRNHGIHRFAGTVGGTMGGAAITTGASALGAMGLGKIVGMKNKALGDMIYRGGKNILGLFNPSKVKRTFKALPEATNIMNNKIKLMNKANTLADKTSKANVVNQYTKNKQFVKGLANQRDSLGAAEKAFIKTNKVSPDELYERGLGMAAGSAGAALGGGISGYTAYSQYGAGRNVRGMIDNKKN